MEDMRTTLNNSPAHHLSAGKAPVQLWNELQESLLPITKLLDADRNLKGFEWDTPLDGLGHLLLNVSLDRKPKEQDATLRERLIPGRIGEKAWGLEPQVSNLEPEIPNPEFQTLNLKSRIKSEYPIYPVPPQPGKSKIILEKAISRQPELTAALNGDESKRKEIVQKILKREVELEKDLRNEVRAAQKDTECPVQLPIAKSISVKDNQLFYQLKKLKPEDVTQILLRKLISPLTLSHVDESSRLVSQLEKAAQLKAEATGRDREKIPDELAEERNIIKPTDLPGSVISNLANQAFLMVTHQEDKAGVYSSPEQSYGVLEKGVLPNHPII